MKVKRKLTKEQKSLLVAMLIGDGTISTNYVFKMCHDGTQEEFLNWKINLLNQFQLKNNGLKTYISTKGYNVGKRIVYSQLSVIPTIKALRRSIYTPKKTINRKLLNWLTPLGLAIWYMDDGFINVNTSKQRHSIQHSIRISTCLTSEKELKIIIDYFKEVWHINFRKYNDNNHLSISTCTENDTKKFVSIIKPYILQVPSLLYKIRNNYTKAQFLELQKEDPKCETLLL